VKIDGNLPVNLPEGSKGRAKEQAAVALNTNKQSVNTLRKAVAKVAKACLYQILDLLNLLILPSLA
jgi:hypothetical protein